MDEKLQMVGKKKICLALDVDDSQRAIDFVIELKDYIGLFKVGFQLFVNEGPSVVERIVEKGGQVFLDLKLHDIPNTVAAAARSMVRLGVSMFNVHASGGKEMVRAAVISTQEEAAKKGVDRPLVLAVTVLTSINEEILRDELLIQRGVKDTVCRMAEVAKAGGADGVIASPQEVPIIRKVCGSDFLIVTPGVRPKWSAIGDQKRITTPSDAIKLGSDWIVIGRPIMDSDNPVESTLSVIQEIIGEIG